MTWNQEYAPWGPWLSTLVAALPVVVLLGLAELAIGVAEDAGGRVLRQKRQDPLLPARALGHVVFLDQSVIAVIFFPAPVSISSSISLASSVAGAAAATPINVSSGT